ncbi:MAG: Cache 3/Cache 2 fusion domain-containing protein [Clostridia bacterium]|nr:Cache 3/Cache 2 fusion domain-containing protein [Clostridia bacterium]
MFKSLYSKLICVYLLMVLIPMLLIGYISYQSKKEAMLNQLEQMMILSADNLVVAVGDIINEAISDTGLLAVNPVLRKAEWSQGEIDSLLDSFLEHNQIYQHVILLNTNGIIVAERQPIGIEGNDLSERPWFKEVISGKEVFFSDIYLSSITKEPILLLGGAVKDIDGNALGVVSPSIDIRYLWTKMHNFASLQQKLGLNGYAFLVNGDGEIIVHPDQSKIMVEDYFATSGLTRDQLKEFSSTGELFYQKKDNTINAVAFISQVPGFQNDWHVIISVPEAELYAPLNQLLRKYLIWFSIILLATLAMAMKLAQNIVAPVNYLVRSTADIVAGKKVALEHVTSYREINILNDAFNTMLEKLQKREQELIRAERLNTVGQLSAGFAHEIRNPLATIRGFIQLMERSCQETSREKQYYHIMIKEIDRINGIVGDLLALAKTGVNSNIKETDVNSVIEEMMLLFQPQGEETGILLTAELGSLPAICTDSNQLKQVFINFIKNAFEAMADTGGSLLITTTFLEGEQAVKIQFADTGCGMNEETLEKIGTPFFTTKESGTGLGLLTSYGIIKDLEGTLFIESELGKGSVFTIKFPLELSYCSREKCTQLQLNPA